MKNSKPLDMAPPVTVGVEDTFSYMISDECVGCEACVANCPVHAIAEQSGRLEVDPAICIDCGTCSAVCPTGARAGFHISEAAYQRSTRKTVISIRGVP